ncbi:MAG TPA: cation transporter, partial [Desulfuromonadales bacterium]|nr:cation transporter [Desulfuromonadales bacterium]
MKHLELGIEGMSCAACSSRVERALGKLSGMHEAAVNLATRRASLDYDEEALTPAQIVATVG